jgi:hypothetical protein
MVAAFTGASSWFYLNMVNDHYYFGIRILCVRCGAECDVLSLFSCLLLPLSLSFPTTGYSTDSQVDM